MEKLSWYGCYDGGWQAAPLVAEAYAHPAKISFGLAERIYRHMLAEGWLHGGGNVVVTQELLDDITAELRLDGIPYL